MDFEDYLLSKKIDSSAFERADPKQWKSWKLIFDQVHPASFTAQKLFFINQFRHIYPVQEEVKPQEPKPAKQKPVIKTARHSEERSSGEKKPVAKIKPKIGTKPKPRMESRPKPKIQPKAEEADKKPTKPRPIIKPVIKKPKDEDI